MFAVCVAAPPADITFLFLVFRWRFWSLSIRLVLNLPPSVAIEKQLPAGLIQSITGLFVAALAKLFRLPAGKRLKSQIRCLALNYSLFDFSPSARSHSLICLLLHHSAVISHQSFSFIHSFIHNRPRSAFSSFIPRPAPPPPPPISCSIHPFAPLFRPSLSAPRCLCGPPSHEGKRDSKNKRRVLEERRVKDLCSFARDGEKNRREGSVNDRKQTLPSRLKSRLGLAALAVLLNFSRFG